MDMDSSRFRFLHHIRSLLFRFHHDKRTFYAKKLVKFLKKVTCTNFSSLPDVAQNNRAKLHHTLQYSSDYKAAMNTGGL